MFNKWVVTITLSLALLSGVAVGADKDELVSYTNTIEHNHSGGGKNIDSIELIAPKTPKNSCAVFNSAEIKYKKLRQGQAKIISQPVLKCDPRREKSCTVTVSWQHSPAGRLNYTVKVGWTLKPC